MTTPAEKATRLRQLLLYVFNFEVSRPPVRDIVNPAFHLIEASERREIAAAFASRAVVENMPRGDYWNSLLNFWMFDPAVISDDAALKIKLHQFHQLVNPDGADAARTAEVAAPTEPSTRQRAFRKRSTRTAAPTSTALVHMVLKDAEAIYDAASFLAQHHGVWANGSVKLIVRANPAEVEAQAAHAISRLTHQLGMSIGGFHWVYANRKCNDTVVCRVLAHVPYERIRDAEDWLKKTQAGWEAKQHPSISFAWHFHDPQTKNARYREISRRKFHWEQIRLLWADLDPAIEHWGHNIRQPLIDLLRARPKQEAPSEPLNRLKRVGVSHSLGPKARQAAEANMMGLLSAFRDAKWDQIDTGWELDEHRDRLADQAARQEQLSRLERLGNPDDALPQKRYDDARANLISSWPNDPKLRPRTWNPWWSDDHKPIRR